MDMLSPGSGLNLLDKKWRIYGRTPTCPPTYIGAQGDVGNSAIAKGCTVLGEVKNSVLSTGTCVDEGAEVSYSVVMPGAVIGKGAKVSYAIIGEGCRIGENAVVGARRAAWTLTTGASPWWGPMRRYATDRSSSRT